MRDDTSPAGETIQMTPDFSSETMKAKRKWHIFQVLKENCQIRIQ